MQPWNLPQPSPYESAPWSQTFDQDGPVRNLTLSDDDLPDTPMSGGEHFYPPGGQQPAPQPGDVYRNRNPMQRQQVDLRTQLPNEETPEQSSAESPIAPGSAPSGWDTLPDTGLISYQDHELILSRLAHEGGAPLINFLLAKAIPSENELDKTLPPAISRV